MRVAWRGKSLVRSFGPNGVFGVRRVRGEVTKGLAVVEPLWRGDELIVIISRSILGYLHPNCIF